MIKRIFKKVTCFVAICTMLVAGVSVASKSVSAESNKTKLTASESQIGVVVSSNEEGLQFSVNEDNTYSLRWTAQSGKLGESLTIDLGAVKSINKLAGLRIAGSISLAYTNLKFESSTDGENWTLLKTFDNKNDVELTLDEVLETRYLKVSSVSMTPVWSVSTDDLLISEGEVPFEINPIVKTVDTTRFSVGVTTSADSLEVKDNYDNTADIYWVAQSGKVDEYMLFDLGKVEDVEKIKNLSVVKSNSLAYTNLSLEYSSDLEEWVTLKTTKTDTDAGCVLDCEKAFTARYIRLRSYGSGKPIFGVDAKNFRILLKGEKENAEPEIIDGINIDVSCNKNGVSFAANKDATYSLRWTAQSGKLGESLTIDLGAVKSINKLAGLRIASSISLAYTNLKFESSTDGENWTLLKTFDNKKDTELTIDEVLETRYLKVSSVSMTPVWSISTTDLFISEGDVPFELNPVVKKVKTKKYTVGVTTSPKNLNILENADGTLKFDWLADSGKTDEYIIFDLGEVKDVKAIKNLSVSRTNSLAYTNLALECSEDLDDWTVLKSATSKTDKDYSFDYSGDFSARYIRLRSYGNSVPVFKTYSDAFNILLKEDVEEATTPETTTAVPSTTAETTTAAPTTAAPTTAAPTTTKKVEETTAAPAKVALKAKASAKKVKKAKKYQFKFYKSASNCRKDKNCVLKRTSKKKTVTVVISAANVEKYDLEGSKNIYFTTRAYTKKWSKWSTPKKVKTTEVGK